MRLKQLFGLDSLKGQLRVYTLLLTVLPVFLATAFFTLFQRGQVISRELHHLVYGLHQERNVVRSWIDERFDDALCLARVDAVLHSDLPAITTIFHVYVETHPYVREAIYIDADGRVTASNLGKTGVSLSDREYFKKAMQGHSALELVPAGRLTGQPVCIFSVPVRVEGHFAGVVAIPILLESMDQWLHEAIVRAGTGVILADDQGRILAPSAAVTAGGGPGKARVAPALLATGETGGRYVDAAGREMLGACVPLGREGWRLVSCVPVSEILAGYRRQAIWLVLGALATIILLLPLLVRLSGNIERPLTALAAYARELRATDYAAACPLVRSDNIPREVAELHEAFCTMAGEVRGHIDAAERLSDQDVLTGLYNRRFLFSGGLKLLAAAKRAGNPCACLMLDVDHFKAVNDTYGHSAGDRVLAHLGHVLATCARKSDLVARYGGEEFAVLVTGADAPQAVLLAERIRQRLAEEPCRCEERILAVTVSIGVASVRERVEYGEGVLDDLLARADKALYAAKAAGRDRVVMERETL